MRVQDLKFLIFLLCLFVAFPLYAQNLVPNGDFEDGFTGWNHLSNGGAVATYTLETAAPFAGTNSLKAEVTTLGENPWSAQSLGPSIATSISASYTMTFYAKAANANTKLRMVLQTNNYLAKEFTLSTSWQQYTWTFTAQETAPRVKIHYFQLGTFWLDNISVEPVVVSPPNPALVLTMNPNVRHQEMLGFGGALTWYSPRILTSPHSATIKQLIYEDLGLDIIRFKNWYHSDNYPQDKGTQNLPSQFAFDSTKTLFDEAKAANHDLRVLLSSWTPPIALKSNGSLTNGGTLASNDDGYMYDALGQYWTDLLDNLGWTPDYISFQNEPGFTAPWESCIFKPTETSEFAGYGQASDAIHNAIKDRPNAPVMIGSEGENLGAFLDMKSVLLGRPYLGAYAYHIYNITSASNVDNANAQMRRVRDEFPDRPNFMTEFSRDNLDWLATARAIHNTVVEANTSAYIYWKLVWTTAADSMIAIAQDGSYSVGPHYHMLKHYSKHVSNGHQRIEVTGSTSDVRISGFLHPDGTEITLVVLNGSSAAKDVQLAHDTLPVSGTLAWQSVDGNFYQDLGAIDIANTQTLPAASMTTYVVSLSTTLNGLDTDRFHLIDPFFDGNVFSVKVPAQPGIRYSLWKSPNLSVGSWGQVPGANQTLEDDTVIFTDPDPGAPPHFYRVRANW